MKVEVFIVVLATMTVTDVHMISAVLATSKNFMAALSMKLIGKSVLVVKSLSVICFLGVGVVIVILVLLSIIAVVCFTMARKEYK